MRYSVMQIVFFESYIGPLFKISTQTNYSIWLNACYISWGFGPLWGKIMLANLDGPPIVPIPSVQFLTQHGVHDQRDLQAVRNSSISLRSLCSVTRPPCFTPSQNSFARIFLWVRSGIRRSRSQIRRFARVGPLPWVIRWSSSVSWTWSLNCCTNSLCRRLMSTNTSTLKVKR